MISSTVGRIWNPGIMSSIREDWATPKRLAEMLRREFGLFGLDVCASADTAIAEVYFGPRDNGLQMDWTGYGTVWMNPPYGRVIGDWIEKAWRESRHGATVVCLLPARTDTSWFHDYCLKGEIRFLRGRLSFDDYRQGRCPFPSMIVIFRPQA
jgi:phage N-6-adenine-methyltransferase